jgi:hypothetical protein
VSDDCRHLAVRDEFLGDLGGGSALTIIVARDQAKWVAVDAACLIYFFDCQLYALQVLLPVTLLPGTCSADDVRLLVDGAAREH